MSPPAVTIVFLVFNRREELRTSLRMMLRESDYEGTVDVIVVDNASTDGSGEMVRAEFPDVRLVSHRENVGVSGWNAGLGAATGRYVLALDDDCYLPRDGLTRAVAAAEQHDADLVSFKVVSTRDPDHVFSEQYPTGLFTFWGCAVLMRREVVDELGGYDPEIFVWGNELEFMLRFFDRGLRHLHLPEVEAQHMKSLATGKAIGWQPYRVNAGRFGYIAAKLLRPRDAVGALIAVLALRLRDAVRVSPGALTAIPVVLREFVHGLRNRQAVRNPDVSRAYRRHFLSFVSPWRYYRGPAGAILGRPPRWERFFEQRARFYPDSAGTLEFAPRE